MADSEQIVNAINRRMKAEAEALGKSNPVALYSLGMAHAGIALGVAQALCAVDEAEDVPAKIDDVKKCC